MSDTLLLFYVTVPDQEVGVQIARTLVERKLIACGNVLPPHTAVYNWDGKVQQDSEHVLILKTRKTLAQKVEAEVSALHPYDCPCILQLTPTDTNTPFIDWVNEQTKA